MDYADDVMSPDPTDPVIGEPTDTPGVSQQDKNLLKQFVKIIRADKLHHKKAFDRMRQDMQLAMWGSDKVWGESENYRANISGRHVKQRTSALYAKNPRVKATRKESLDFALWDENPASLQLAMQTIQTINAATQIAAASPPELDPMTGVPIPAQPQLPEGMSPDMLQQAMAVVQDYQQGTARRTMVAKYGKTLEVLFNNAMTEQKPLDFKTGMKQVVRRTCTTGVGYVEVGFQREMGPRPGLTEQLADARTRLDHLQNLAAQVAEGDLDEDAGERAELEMSLAALQAEPEIVLREGLIFDYPQSTKVIPDKKCRALVGFVGAGHVTVEYIYTVDQVREIFGVDLKDGSYTSYTIDPGSQREISENDVLDDNYSWEAPAEKKNGFVCVWKCYDKPSGLVYWIADGHDVFLRQPAAPEVFVEDFWPVYALTFNAVESEEELFPPSDVRLMYDMQKEHNRSRQGMREHREAARPRWVYMNGAFGGEDDPMILKELKPFQMAGLNFTDPAQTLDKILQPVPVPGVDPNLYATEQYFGDIQVVVGAQEAQFGGVSQATATESAIAANSTASSDSSSIDDLDAFLTVVARASGQVLQKEMSEEQVKKIVGPGAVWPEMTLADIANEVYLEVAMGSTGKPNQAVEVNNWQQLAPILMQIPGISPEWMARETIKRLDDRLDLADALTAGLPSIVAQNGLAQSPPPPAADPAADPNAQGGKGAGNAPAAPKGPGGSDPAFGSNQVPGGV